MDVTPRETLVITHDSPGVIHLKRDYPWVVATRAYVKGGDANGGDPGYILLELYDVDPATILCSDPACVMRRWKHSHYDGWPEHPDYKGR